MLTTKSRRIGRSVNRARMATRGGYREERGWRCKNRVARHSPPPGGRRGRGEGVARTRVKRRISNITSLRHLLDRALMVSSVLRCPSFPPPPHPTPEHRRILRFFFPFFSFFFSPFTFTQERTYPDANDGPPNKPREGGFSQKYLSKKMIKRLLELRETRLLRHGGETRRDKNFRPVTKR